MLRKLFLANVIGIFATESNVTAPVLGLLVCLVFLYVFIKIEPYNDRSDTKISIVLAYSLTLFYLAALMIKTESVSGDDSFFTTLLILVLVSGPTVVVVDLLLELYLFEKRLYQDEEDVAGVKCRKCGNIFMEDAVFCRLCGSARPGGKSFVETPSSEQNLGDVELARLPAKEVESGDAWLFSGTGADLEAHMKTQREAEEMVRELLVGAELGAFADAFIDYGADSPAHLRDETIVNFDVLTTEFGLSEDEIASFFEALARANA